MATGQSHVADLLTALLAEWQARAASWLADDSPDAEVNYAYAEGGIAALEQLRARLELPAE